MPAERKQHPTAAILVALIAVMAVVIGWLMARSTYDLSPVGVVVVVVLEIAVAPGVLWLAWRLASGRWGFRGPPPARDALAWFWHFRAPSPVAGRTHGSGGSAGCLEHRSLGPDFLLYP